VKFIYCICNEDVKNHLKHEWAFYCPASSFAFSTTFTPASKNIDEQVSARVLMTFKIPPQMNEKKWQLDRPVFSQRSGLMIDKFPSLEQATRAFEEMAHKQEVKPVLINIGGDGKINEQDEKSFFETLKNMHDRTIIFEIFEVKKKNAPESDYFLGKSFLSPLEFVMREQAIEVLSDAPSRAYKKILEGLKLNAIFNPEQLIKNDVVLEVGSSPGGASYALVKKGAKVIGLDPGAMDERLLLDRENFFHVQKPIQDFKLMGSQSDLKSCAFFQQKIDWVLVDMNLSPIASLKEMQKVFENDYVSKSLKGAFMTLKMTDLKYVEQLEGIGKFAAKFNLRLLQLTSLKSHKKEVVMILGSSLQQ